MFRPLGKERSVIIWRRAPFIRNAIIYVNQRQKTNKQTKTNKHRKKKPSTQITKSRQTNKETKRNHVKAI